MQPQLKRSQVLGLAFLAFIVVFLLWQAPANSLFSVILYPLRLFVTFVHETGHGLTAVLTGGIFIDFQVLSDGRGLAHFAGGNTLLVLQMGYISAALFGAILLFAANRVRRVNVVILLIGLYMTGSGLLFSHGGRVVFLFGFGIAVVLWLLGEHYRRYSGWLWVLAWLCGIGTAFLLIFDTDRTLVVGILGGAVLMGMAVFASRPVVVFVLNVMAFATGLNAISDIWTLTRLSENVTTDATQSASLTHLPMLFFVVLWAGIALALIGGSVYLTFIRRGDATKDTAA
ncbi:MAG TPA: M50 family metallopeptidase [Aggregatilineales bacterium]|nr:M50 family metallopeptidase [Aggregatilineales bacterium]